MHEIEIFADSKPIDDQSRVHCRVLKINLKDAVEIWVDDKLIFESGEWIK